MAMRLASDMFDAVLRETGEATGLPNQAYTGEDFLILERDRLWSRSWVCVGVASKLRKPGFVIPVEIVGMPVILLRDQDGSVRAFHNVCSHRGAKLVTSPRRVSDSLRCPYHGWCYKLDGKICKTPGIGGPGIDRLDGFDPARHGLKSIACGVWADMIFVNIDGKAPPLEDYLAPLIERWKAYDFSVLRHAGKAAGSSSITVEANWKLAVENFCESYHLPMVHPGLNGYSRLDDHYHIMIDDEFGGQGSTVYAPRISDGKSFPQFPGLSDETKAGAEYIAIYPNVLLGIQNDHFWCIYIEAKGPGRTDEHLEIYYIGDGADDESLTAARQETLERWRRIMDEDIMIIERLQQGRHSPGFQGGCFTPLMDAPSHHFSRWVAQTMIR